VIQARTRWSASPKVLVLSIAAVVALACSPHPIEAPGVLPRIQLQVDGNPGPDTVIYRRSITRGGQDSIAGTRTVVRRVLAGPDGTPLLEIEQRFPAGGGEIVDTALAELRTLRAVAHRSHQPTRTMRFVFAGKDVEGTVASAGPTGDSVTAVHQAVGGPIFDSNVLDLVVAALPLRRQFTAELPFFIYERGGRVVMPVAVRDRADVTFSELGQRDVWIVTVGVPGAPATVWVDARTRAVLRVRYDISARGLSFTDERATTLVKKG